MPFFLLSKDPDARLSLLSDEVFESRSAALSELTLVTGRPGFSGWDDEVFVFELSSGASVLLMRPSVVPVETPGASSGAAVAVDAVIETEATADVAPPAEAEGESVAAGAEFTEDAAVFEAPVVEKDAPSDELEPTPEVAEVEPTPEVAEPEPTPEVAEDQPVTDVDEAWAAAVVESSDESEDEISLREALRKSAIQMESEGIVAPESVGPVDDAGGTSADTGDVASWPWDVGTGDSETPSFTLDAIEEPGTDEMSLVRAPGDDDTMSAARPVIMGAYSEAGHGATEGDEAKDDPGVTEADPSPASTDELMEVPVSPLEAEADADTRVTDFILDLESPGSGVNAPGYAGGKADLGEMTCNDCVYVETCPHKEGSDPRTCGSFQWK